MKTKGTANLLIILGCLLILSAMGFYGYQYSEEIRAFKLSERTVPMLKEKIEEVRTVTQSGSLHEEDKESSESGPMTEMEIDGERYIGYLSIEKLNLNLPVMSDWDYSRLKKAPCRQFGTAQGKDLVIAGHNYRSHFGALGILNQGDSIIFEDMSGETYCYTVKIVEVVSPDAVEYVKESKWDLVLYTCASSGRKRVMIGANANK